MNKVKYITELKLDEIENSTVIRCINQEGFETILIKNKYKNNNTSSLNNFDLIFKKNIVLVLNNKNFYFHVIICNSKENYKIKSFDISYKYLFNKIDTPLSDEEFTGIILSLSELFEKGSSNTNEQIGFIGELFTLYYFLINDKKDIIKGYHKFLNSKFDIEIDEKNKIEIKTSNNGVRRHSFSYNQLCNSNLNIYISSILLFSLENGTSLYKLFEIIIEEIEDFEYKIILYKYLNKLGINEDNQGVEFDFNRTFESIKFYNSKDIPHISFEIPKGISNLRYESDLTFSNIIDIINVI